MLLDINIQFRTTYVKGKTNYFQTIYKDFNSLYTRVKGILLGKFKNKIRLFPDLIHYFINGGF